MPPLPKKKIGKSFAVDIKVTSSKGLNDLDYQCKTYKMNCQSKTSRIKTGLFKHHYSI